MKIIEINDSNKIGYLSKEIKIYKIKKILINQKNLQSGPIHIKGLFLIYIKESILPKYFGYKLLISFP